MKQYTLPKSKRLFLRASVSRLFAEGMSFMAYPYRVVYRFSKVAATQPAFHVQARCAMMAIVPKKRFKHAVDRNRVKRLTREAFRLQQLPLEQWLTEEGQCAEIAFICVQNTLPTFEGTQKGMTKALRLLHKEYLAHPH